jgi:2-C-methyl-D-erythritol 2,4-cyclodiphosphate synthase
MAGASGVVMISAVKDFVVAKGFVINNVAVQIVGNSPNVSSRRQEAQDVLTKALGAPVSIAGTTSDAMGFTGRGEGVYAIATALVQIP